MIGQCLWGSTGAATRSSSRSKFAARVNAGPRSTHLRARLERELSVSGELFTAIPSECLAQLLGKNFRVTGS